MVNMSYPRSSPNCVIMKSYGGLAKGLLDIVVGFGMEIFNLTTDGHQDK